MLFIAPLCVQTRLYKVHARFVRSVFLRVQLKPKVPICNEIKDKFKTPTAPCPVLSIEITDVKYQSTSLFAVAQFIV